MQKKLAMAQELAIEMLIHKSSRRERADYFLPEAEAIWN
jgi:hypothetical protein